MKSKPEGPSREGTIRIRDFTCPACGKELDAVSDGRGGFAQPKEGDPVACFRCGAVAAYDAAGNCLRGFTEEEAQALAADLPLMRHLMRLIGKIRLFQAAKN